MTFEKFGKLRFLWEQSVAKGANVILMRHAPKAGSDYSELSKEGKQLAEIYSSVLQVVFCGLKLPALAHTSKDRTLQTLRILFPNTNIEDYFKPPDLEVNKVSPFVQSQVDSLHKKIGRFRGYCLNHTYYFLERLGGAYDEEHLHTVVAERMAKGIKLLADHGNPIIYCGHSPAIEVGCEKLLGVSLSELGGFLNPLDSIHLKMVGGKLLEFVARINPIIGYVDLESETFLNLKERIPF